jgi:hypothetical protein
MSSYQDQISLSYVRKPKFYQILTYIYTQSTPSLEPCKDLVSVYANRSLEPTKGSLDDA